MAVRFTSIDTEGFLVVTATVLHTGQTAETFKLEVLNLTNVSGGAVTVDVHVVRSGDTLGDENQIVRLRAIQSNETLILGDVLLQPGDTLEALSDTASAVAVVGWGRVTT